MGVDGSQQRDGMQNYVQDILDQLSNIKNTFEEIGIKVRGYEYPLKDRKGEEVISYLSELNILLIKVLVIPSLNDDEKDKIEEIRKKFLLIKQKSKTHMNIMRESSVRDLSLQILALLTGRWSLKGATLAFTIARGSQWRQYYRIVMMLSIY